MAGVREDAALAMLAARWVGGLGDTVPLTRFLVRIGRSEHNDIVVNQSPISGRHLEITFQQGSWYACDLGSTNGTILEGRRLPANSPTHLPYHATVCLSGVLELCLLPDSTSTSGIRTPRQLHFAEELRPGLIIMQRTGQMQRVHLSGGRTVVGRSSSSDIAIDNPLVSGQHAQVVAQGKDQYQIMDLGSNNGLVYSGQRIQQKMLSGGDRFTIGDQVLIEYQPALGFVTQVSVSRDSFPDRTVYTDNRLRTCPGCGAVNYGPHNHCLICHTPLH